MAAVQGSLDTLQLPEILQLLAEQRKTGILTVQGHGDILAISFLDGQIVGADALSQPLEESLGEILVADGLIERRELARYVARQRAGDGQLLDLLISENRLERRQVLDALRRQTLEILVGLLSWREGDFKFYGGDEVSYENGFRPLRVDEVLLAGLGEDDEPPPSTPHRRYRRIEPAPTVHRIEDLDQSLPHRDDADGVWLTPQEASFFEQVSPKTSLAQIAGQAGVDTERAVFLAFDLERRGLIEAVDEPASPSAPTAPLVPPPPVASPSAAPTAHAASSPAAPSVPATTAAEPRSSTRTESLTDDEAIEAAEALPAAWAPARAAAVLALGLAAAIAAAVISSPAALLLPFPWLDDAQAAYGAERDRVSQLAVDQAAKTSFLLEGRFPEQLERLVALGLLDADEPGRYLYAPSELVYALQPVDHRGVAIGSRLGDGVAGNFLLDPGFLAPAPMEEEPPLVLLD